MSTPLTTAIGAAFQRVGALIGLEKDWASQLQQALNAPAVLNAASKSAGGLVQLATNAEALAGTDDQKALTALGLAGVLDGQTLRRKVAGALVYTSPTATWRRFARITDPGDGNGAYVQLLLTGMGAVTLLERGSAILKMVVRNDTMRARITWLDGAPPLFFFTRRVSAGVYELWGQFAYSQRPHNVILLDGIGVTAWGPDSDTTVAPSGTVVLSNLEPDWSFASGISDWDAAGGPDYFENSIRREPNGLWVSIGLQKTSGAAFVGNDAIMTLGSTLIPASGVNGAQVMVNGYSRSGAGWAGGSVALAVAPNGVVSVNGPPANIHGLFGTFFVPINGA